MRSFLIMKSFYKVISVTLILLSFVAASTAQNKPSEGVVNFVLAENQFATILTAKGYVTRLALPEKAEAAICGDLYDPQTGIGSFVVNSSGNDVFIKASGTKGASNLFVKTASFTFNFYLNTVPDSQAHRVVTVRQAKAGEETTPTTNDAPKEQPASNPKEEKPSAAETGSAKKLQAANEEISRLKKELSDSGGCAGKLQTANDEISRLQKENAADKEELDKRFAAVQQYKGDLETLQKADADIKTKLASTEQELSDTKKAWQKIQDQTGSEKSRLEQENKTKLIQSIVTGVRRASVTNRHLKMGDVDINVDENLFSFNKKLYMKFVVANHSSDKFTMGDLKLELQKEGKGAPLPIEIYEYDLEQPRSNVEVEAGKSAVVILVFDDVAFDKKDKLALVAQDADKKVSRLVLIN
jgi:hypothetical protein